MIANPNGLPGFLNGKKAWMRALGRVSENKRSADGMPARNRSTCGRVRSLSGTSFTDYLCDVSSEWKEKVGTGTSVSWPVGIGGKGNEGVANYVQQQNNSIGYVEFAYATQNHLAYILLKNRAGTFVEPSFESFEDAAATADFDANKDFYLWLNNAPGKKSWPIAGTHSFFSPKRKKNRM